jgi:hypothetical protein
VGFDFGNEYVNSLIFVLRHLPLGTRLSAISICSTTSQAPQIRNGLRPSSPCRLRLH